MSVREFTAPPSTAAQYSRALLGSLAGKKGKELPDLELVLRDVRIDRQQLAAYDRVCGFSQRDTVPSTFGFVLAFPLQMELMTLPEWPFAAMGTVHIRNVITQHRPVSAGETLTLSVRAANLRPHDKGLQFDFLTTVRAGDEVVWEVVSTMLRRGGGSGSGEQKPSAPRTADEAPRSVVQWIVPADIGRRYGAVSGDRNPIHLYAFTARLFGFPRAIAHGMWTKARCLAALESKLPDAYTVDVQFKLPVLLPAKVAFFSDDVDGGIAFGVSDYKSGKPHLAGTIVPA